MIWSLAVICGQVHHRVCCVGTSLSSVLFKFTTCVPAWSVWWISYMERARPDGHRRSPNISTCPAGWTSCTVFLVLFLHHLIWCVYKTPHAVRVCCAFIINISACPIRRKEIEDRSAHLGDKAWSRNMNKLQGKNLSTYICIFSASICIAHRV